MKSEKIKKVVREGYAKIATTVRSCNSPLNSCCGSTDLAQYISMKTGYTEDAGLCLVTYAVNDGVELVGIVLDAADRKGDMGLMLDHGFGTMGVTVEHNLFGPTFGPAY